MMVAEKRLCSLRATLRGPAGHGSLPVRGGAMGRLGRLLAALDRKRLPVQVLRYDPGAPAPDMTLFDTLDAILSASWIRPPSQEPVAVLLAGASLLHHLSAAPLRLLRDIRGQSLALRVGRQVDRTSIILR